MNPILKLKVGSALAVAVGFFLAAAAPAAPNLDFIRQLNQAFAEVAEKVTPCVVVLTVTPKPDSAKTDATDPDDEGELTPRQFWRRFHEQFEDGPGEKALGQGSGIIVRSNGYILTNRHVVEEAGSIEVRLKDGRRFPATIRGVDIQSDVAVLKIEATGLPVARLGSSARTRVGEFAIAVGAPYSLDYSVTFGHVSAKSRSNVVPAYFSNGLQDQDFIQTDANINPGNSGGPLVNIDGEVIGINTLIRGLRTGIGFAIPSDLAREVADEIIANGKFTRAWLGVSILGLDDEPALRERYPGLTNGVLVRAIVPDGPSAGSELRVGDVITKVEGQRVATVQQLRNRIRSRKIGRPVALEVVRDSRTVRVSVSPGEYVEPKPVVVARRKSSELVSAYLGLNVEPLTTDSAKKFGVKLDDGVLVSTVFSGSPAAKIKLKPGDIITSVNHQPTLSPAQFREALQEADLKTGVLVEFLRDGKSRTETLKATD